MKTVDDPTVTADALGVEVDPSGNVKATVRPLWNPFPEKYTACGALPATSEGVTRPVTTGGACGSGAAGVVTANVNASDDKPVGFVTRRLKFPALVRAVVTLKIVDEPNAIAEPLSVDIEPSGRVIATVSPL